MIPDAQMVVTDWITSRIILISEQKDPVDNLLYEHDGLADFIIMDTVIECDTR